MGTRTVHLQDVLLAYEDDLVRAARSAEGSLGRSAVTADLAGLATLVGQVARNGHIHDLAPVVALLGRVVPRRLTTSSACRQAGRIPHQDVVELAGWLQERSGPLREEVGESRAWPRGARLAPSTATVVENLVLALTAPGPPLCVTFEPAVPPPGVPVPRPFSGWDEVVQEDADVRNVLAGLVQSRFTREEWKESELRAALAGRYLREQGRVHGESRAWRTWAGAVEEGESPANAWWRTEVLLPADALPPSSFEEEVPQASEADSALEVVAVHRWAGPAPRGRGGLGVVEHALRMGTNTGTVLFAGAGHAVVVLANACAALLQEQHGARVTRLGEVDGHDHKAWEGLAALWDPEGSGPLADARAALEAARLVGAGR